MFKPVAPPPQASLFDVYDSALGGVDTELLAEAAAMYENPVVDNVAAFGEAVEAPGSGLAPMEPAIEPAMEAAPAPETPEYKQHTQNMLLERAKERKAASEMFQAKSSDQGKKSAY